jgi:glycosyltransferase involved in cell wall biosynthesis
MNDQTAPHYAMSALVLAREGHLITFMAWGNAAPGKLLDTHGVGIEYQVYPKRGWLSALRFLAGVLRTVLSTRPDLVYVQGAQQTPFVLWLLCMVRRCQLIYHTQDYVGPGQHWFYEFCERVFARHADWVISNEPNRARFLASSYRLKQMPEVIRTALPLWWPVPERDESYRQEVLQMTGLASVERLCLIAAGGAYRDDRMSPQLVEALVDLPANHVVVFTEGQPGSISRRLCEEHCRRLNLEGRVVFWKADEYVEMLRLLSVCDLGILLYPNSGIGHFYQCPGRLTEYLRCGLPIVTSQFPGLELLVMKYGIGELADPYSAASIATAIRKVSDISEVNVALRRQKMRDVAQTDLAYETQARPVFDKIFGGVARNGASQMNAKLSIQ